MMKNAGAAMLATLLASVAAAHGGHGAAPMHLHDAEMLGLAALAAGSVGTALWLWLSGRD